MLCLELHSAHENKPEQIILTVISAGDNLVVNEGSLNFLIVSLLALVIADQNEGGVEACEKLTQDEVDEILSEVE